MDDLPVHVVWIWIDKHRELQKRKKIPSIKIIMMIISLLFSSPCPGCNFSKHSLPDLHTQPKIHLQHFKHYTDVCVHLTPSSCVGCEWAVSPPSWSHAAWMAKQDDELLFEQHKKLHRGFTDKRGWMVEGLWALEVLEFLLKCNKINHQIYKQGLKR